MLILDDDVNCDWADDDDGWVDDDISCDWEDDGCVNDNNGWDDFCCYWEMTMMDSYTKNNLSIRIVCN